LDQQYFELCSWQMLSMVDVPKGYSVSAILIILLKFVL